MPNAFLSKVDDVCDIPYKELETMWAAAKKIAAERGHPEGSDGFYPYVMGIMKNKVGSECRDLLAKHEVLFPEPVTRAGAVLARLSEATELHEGPRNAKKRKTMADKLGAVRKADSNEPKPAQAPVSKEKPQSSDPVEPSLTPNTGGPKNPLKQVTPPADAKPTEEPQSPADIKLARDLGELYQELIHRWSSIVDPDGETYGEVTPVEWSEDNPYAALPEAVREVIQAGAAFHYAELEEMRSIAERAMREWQHTQPQLLEDMENALKGLPERHLRVLRPIVKELVARNLLPEAILLSLDPIKTADPSYWAKAFPSLLAANAYQHDKRTGTSAQVSDAVTNTVTETLTECLLG